MIEKAICVFCGEVVNRNSCTSIYIKCLECVRNGNHDLLPIDEFRKKKEKMFKDPESNSV